MSPAIKFRAWNQHTGEWVRFNGVHDMSCWQAFAERVELLQGNDWVWQQFTGLQDKQGVEIFVGDIVQFNYQGELIKAVVSYDPDAARFVKTFTSSYGRETKDLSSYAGSHKVIGNIYNHPGLAE